MWASANRMGDLVERLERLSKLKADGLLSEEEFARAKDQLLGGAAPRPAPTPSGSSTTSASVDEEGRAASVRQVRVPTPRPSCCQRGGESARGVGELWCSCGTGAAQLTPSGGEVRGTGTRQPSLGSEQNSMPRQLDWQGARTLDLLRFRRSSASRPRGRGPSSEECLCAW